MNYFGESYPALNERFYFQMKLIRCFEEKLSELFSQNKLDGTIHTCIGQEANAVAIMNAINLEKDIVWSNHRCHGHFLAYSGNVYGLLSEIVGTSKGICGGRGGSQHLCEKNFYSSGIQGGTIPIALGCAYIAKKTNDLAVVFIGDGTLGEGILYETLNMASLWSVPLLFVVENNGIAQTTPSHLAISGSPAERAMPFNIKSYSFKGTDVVALHKLTTEIISFIRKEQRPAWLHVDTIRLAPHSKGDDTRHPDEVSQLAQDDPLLIHGKRIKDRSAIDLICHNIIEEECKKVLSEKYI